MRERAEAIGGDLSVKSVPGQGTAVEVRIPFRERDQNKPPEKESV
jgi:nitrate/nitrite-specific signal transduction histidine kinase